MTRFTVALGCLYIRFPADGSVLDVAVARFFRGERPMPDTRRLPHGHQPVEVAIVNGSGAQIVVRTGSR